MIADARVLAGEPTTAPLRLARVHATTAVDDVVVLSAPRVHAWWTRSRLDDLVEGAGFAAAGADPDGGRRLRRLRSLPDVVGPRMALLVVGLNPSEYAADAGVGYARPGNRFWPAALMAGVVTRDRDPWHALEAHGVGMTDLVKRATRQAAALEGHEHAHGLARVARLAAWLRPGAVCVVGLAGWRAAMDRAATPGWQRRRLGGVPTYLMPSTSGLNAHSSLEDLADHLRRAAGGPPERG